MKIYLIQINVTYRANPETDPDALYPKDTIGEEFDILHYLTKKWTGYKLSLYYWVYFTISVMALYPQTTCFYKAVVNVPPLFHNDEYEVLFEDSSYSEGFSPPLKVAQRYVIAIRDKKTIK